MTAYPAFLPDGRRYVRGDGPTPCPVLFLGESPGDTEDAEGQAFVGRTGQVCDAVWAKAGWRRGLDMRVENVLRYKPEFYDKGGDIQPYEVARDRVRLLEQLAKTDPKWIFCMGRWAAQEMVGWWLEEKGFRLSLDWANGVTFRVPRLDDVRKTVTVVVAFHPASGFHDSTMASRFYQALVAFTAAYWGDVSPRIWAPDDRPVDYQEGGDIETRRSPIGLDTEWLTDGTPYCLTASWADRQGVIVYERTRYRADKFTRYILHNAAADLYPLEQLGLDLADADWDDTMIAARVVGEPGGLKALATRHLGVRMQDYDDVLGPVRQEKWGGYLRRALVELRTRHSWAVRRGTAWSLATRLTAARNAVAEAAILGSEPVDIEARLTSDTLHSTDRAKLERHVGAYPTVDLRDVDEDVRVAYACRDADTTRRLAPVLDAKLDAWGARAAYEADRGMVPVLARIRRVGMQVDRDALRALEVEMEAAQESLRATVVELAGRKINPASTADIAKVLFDDLGQPARKLTATGLQSTEAKQLEAMRNRLLGRKAEGTIDDAGVRALAFLDGLVDFRHVSKLKSTSVTGMWDFLDKDGRLHPDLRMEAATGRCVAGGRDERGRETPNLLAVPARSSWGKKVRKCFPAGPRRKYIVGDLSQVEMRQLADCSGDPTMIEIFEQGRDMHAETAVYIFNKVSGKYPDLTLCPGKECKHTSCVQAVIPTSLGKGVTFRQASKTLGFGMVFGMTEYGGQEQMAKQGLLATREEVRLWIDGWLDFFCGIRPYWESVHARAREDGYSATKLGRRRYLPWIYSPEERDRSEAERQSVSQKVQGGAIESAKLWIAYVHARLAEYRAKGAYAEVALTIHDEADCVTDADIAEEVAAMIKTAVGETIKMRVPVSADCAIADRWGDAKA